MHSFMKVFHIFVMCVVKWQQKCTTTTENLVKDKPSNNCLVENILVYHRMMTMDLEDEYWETKNNSNVPW